MCLNKQCMHVLVCTYYSQSSSTICPLCQQLQVKCITGRHQIWSGLQATPKNTCRLTVGWLLKRIALDAGQESIEVKKKTWRWSQCLIWRLSKKRSNKFITIAIHLDYPHKNIFKNQPQQPKFISRTIWKCTAERGTNLQFEWTCAEAKNLLNNCLNILFGSTA